MNDYKGLSGGLYLMAEWIMKFALVNIYFLLFNLPIIFILLLILSDPLRVNIGVLVIPIIIMLPILFYPAAMAMFAVVRDYIMKSQTPTNIFRTFSRYYQENYQRSCVGGLLFTLLWGIWAVNLYYLYQINQVIFFIMLASGIILYVFNLNFFSVNVHYHLSFKLALKHTLLITLSRPVLFLALSISSGFILYISFQVFSFLVPFFMFSFISFFAFAAFYRSYLRVNDINKAVED